MNNKNVVMLTVGIFLTVVLFAIVLWLSFATKPSNRGVDTAISVPDILKKEYSSFDKIAPGKDGLSDVEKTNGKPLSIKKEGDKTYLIYSTPSPAYKNVVLVKNGVVAYALEYVFYSYKKPYSDYLSMFGDPNLTLYGGNSYMVNTDYAWGVFLNKGVAIQSSNNYVTALLYFAKQDKASFLKNVAEDLGLSEEKPQEEVHYVVPVN